MPFFERQRTAQGIYGPAKPGQRPWWARPFAFSSVLSGLGYVASALLLYSVIFGFCTINRPNLTRLEPTNAAATVQSSKPLPGHLTHVGIQKAALIIVWVLAPPIWFWLEYFAVWAYEDATKRLCLDEFKFGQELSGKIWLAAVTALGILYFGKDIKGL